MNELTPKKLTKSKLPKEIKAAVAASQEKKAEEIMVLDLREISSFTDFFLIMQGNSAKQNGAIYDGVSAELKKIGIKPLSVEGKSNAEWILMDYGHFILHIFTKDARDYYSLEKLWADGQKLLF